MFVVNSTPEGQNPDPNSDSYKRAHSKPKPHSFANLSHLMQEWQPSDPLIPRKSLVNEILMLLEQKEYSCVKSCIPALIVDKQFPIELLHYKSESDLNELMTRMLWMRQEFNSAMGILLGINDEETAAKVQEAFEDMLASEEDCVVLLV